MTTFDFATLLSDIDDKFILEYQNVLLAMK